MVEMGLHEGFSEIHEVNENDRNGTFECGRKCIDYVLGTEGIRSMVEGIELMMQWNCGFELS